MAALGANTIRALVRSNGTTLTVSWRAPFCTVTVNSWPMDLATPSAEANCSGMMATSSASEGTSMALMISISRPRLEA